MINLVWEYMLIILVLFGTNFGLLLNTYGIKHKVPVYILLYSLSLFLITIFISNIKLDYFINYIAFLLFFIGLIIFILILYQLNSKNEKLNFLTFIGLILISYFIVIYLVLSSSSLSFDFSLLIFAILCVFALLSFKLSKNSIFKGKISEYFILESILLMILGLTYPYVTTLDYSEFVPFTILTPTYEIIVLIIFIIALLVIGVYLNDYRKKR